MTGNGNEPDTTHASVGQFDDIDETILSMLEKARLLAYAVSAFGRYGTVDFRGAIARAETGTS